MLPAFEQDNRKPELLTNHRHQAATEAGAYDGQINRVIQLRPPHWSHAILSSTTCSRFIFRKRSARNAWQPAQDARNPQRSANTLPTLSPRPYSIADSNVCNVGGANRPFAISSSMTPFPARVGINTAAVAPCSMAKSNDRSAQCSASAAGI